MRPVRGNSRSVSKCSPNSFDTTDAFRPLFNEKRAAAQVRAAGGLRDLFMRADSESMIDRRDPLFQMRELLVGIHNWKGA